MSKFTFPTIMAATVMFAMVFAFMPVEDAQAVHTTIQGTQMTQSILVGSADIATDDPFTCDSDAAFIVYIATGGPAADNAQITVSDGAQTITIFGDITNVAAGSGGFGGDGFSGSIAADAATTITLTGNGADDLLISLITTSGATADCT